MYSKQVLDYFYDASHALNGEPDPNAFYATAGVLDNGDYLEWFALVDHGVFSRLLYRIRAGVATMACTECIASTLEGQSVDCLNEVTSTEVLSTLQLPKTRQNSAFLPLSALRDIVSQYKDVHDGNL